MFPRCALIAAAVVLGAALVAPAAHADPESDAKDLFDRGREMRQSGDCASAVPLFHKAYEIYPSGLGNIRNAAECEEQLGRWASARRSWLELKRATMFAHDAKYEGWSADADTAAKRLAPRVSHLRVDVDTSGASDAGLEVTVAGEKLPRELVGTVLDRDPGRYVVRARLGDREAQANVELTTGESRTVRLTFPPVSSAGGGAPTVSVSSSNAHHGSAWTPAGVVTLSVGLAALAGMGVAIGVRQDALATLSTQCPNYQTGPCPASLRSVVDRGSTASTLATALAIGGGVAAGAGVLFLILGATSQHEGPVALHVSPFGASLEGRF